MWHIAVGSIAVFALSDSGFHGTRMQKALFGSLPRVRVVVSVTKRAFVNPGFNCVRQEVVFAITNA